MPSPNHHCRFLPVCCSSFVVSAARDTSPAAASSTGRLRVAGKKRKRLKPLPSRERCFSPSCECSGAAVL
ncbi:hypothetical protein PVAP13_1KG377800 [Panicum virgatum]|uniref:Uncharacterized protein n=1 Tax=Panicum virgatum TaxID=38727 RepID=A0A8T0XL38_PANVG|nr:hypothetical protein PVAP13_1KG377800 [Panicum virgatum]